MPNPLSTSEKAEYLIALGIQMRQRNLPASMAADAVSYEDMRGELCGRGIDPVRADEILTMDLSLLKGTIDVST